LFLAKTVVATDLIASAFLRHRVAERAMKNVVSDLVEAATLIMRRDTSTLDETLRRGWPQLYSAWQAVSNFTGPVKRKQA